MHRDHPGSPQGTGNTPNPPSDPLSDPPAPCHSPVTPLTPPDLLDPPSDPPVSPQPDRTYSLTIGTPPTSYFLKAVAGVEKGAARPGQEGPGGNFGVLGGSWGS